MAKKPEQRDNASAPLYVNAYSGLFSDADKGEVFAVTAFHVHFGGRVIIAEFLYDDGDERAKRKASLLASDLAARINDGSAK